MLDIFILLVVAPIAYIGMPIGLIVLSILSLFPIKYDISYIHSWYIFGSIGFLQCVIAALLIGNGYLTYGWALIWFPFSAMFACWLGYLLYEELRQDK